MNWTEESIRDEKLLARLDLELLSQEVVGHGDGLAELVGRHNGRLAALSERFNRLADGRKRLADFRTWADGKLDNLLTERARLMGESWDWLRDLRAALVEREAILKKAEEVLHARFDQLDRRRQQVVDGLRRSMAKVRREMVQASPARGESHFTDLLEGDEAVVAIDEQRAVLQSGLEWVTDRRRRASRDEAAVLVRQEEVFKGLVEASL